MDISVDAPFGMLSSVDEFTLEPAHDRAASYDTLLYKGRQVAHVEARVIEAQFRFPDGGTLLLLNDDTPFREQLTVLLVSPGLHELDRVLLGGAFTPGYLTYAYPSGPDAVAFCWHDLDQVVTVARRRTRLGLRTRWLHVREADPANAARAPRPPSRMRMPQLRWSRRQH